VKCHDRLCGCHSSAQLRIDGGVPRVARVRPGSPVAGSNAARHEPSYGGEKGYWSSESLDWIIYASHENSLTIGGTMLSYIRREVPLGETTSGLGCSNDPFGFRSGCYLKIVEPDERAKDCSLRSRLFDSVAG
jgi:hypothetical protein